MMDLDKPLAGQHVLVVGASSGMGRAVANHAAAAGARLTLMGRNARRLEPVAKEIGGAEIREIDLRREETVPLAVEGIADVSHLVVTAGTYGVALVAYSEPDDWRGIVEERLIGPLFLIKSLGPRLTRSITLFTGSTVRRPSPGAVLPTAALGGVEAMVRALAVELAPVRANAIAPGIVDTPLLDTVLGEAKDEVVRASAACLPARHVGTPDDAASAAMFLMTNPFITGATIALDGGGTLV
jgi:NAD(P)-dependent dehydrogenase (short-subunit alcohol dehydrogenase family)